MDILDFTVNGGGYGLSNRIITTNKIIDNGVTIIPNQNNATLSSQDVVAKNVLDDEIKKIWERLNKTVSLVHNCANCGARLELEEHKQIVNCKYCGSTYIIGAVQPNSTY